MTYLYYKTASTTHTSKPSKKEITEWTHMSDKSKWRITQLPNVFYQTDVSHPDDLKNFTDVTRRETLEWAETAIDGSVEHFEKKLEALKGPKVLKTFK